MGALSKKASNYLTIFPSSVKISLWIYWVFFFPDGCDPLGVEIVHNLALGLIDYHIGLCCLVRVEKGKRPGLKGHIFLAIFAWGL
ncbi:hypothetical protein F4810DRAFT_674679, partial [Camillea tinctor]